MSSETFGALESHAEDALLAAQALARGEPVTAAHVLSGVLAVARTNSASRAFSAFARMVPDLFTAALPEQASETVLPEQFSEPFRRSLELVRSVFSEQWDRTLLWGRDLITAALLAREEEQLVRLLTRHPLNLLRDQWYGFLNGEAELPEAAYEAMWRCADIGLPSDALPGGVNHPLLLWQRTETSISMRKVQRKPWALAGTGAFVLPTGGELSEHLRHFLGHPLFEQIEVPWSERSHVENQLFVVDVPQAARAAGLPPLCIHVDLSESELTPAQAAAAAVEACRLAAQRGAGEVVLPLLGAGSKGLDAASVLRELLCAVRQESQLGMRQLVITTLFDDDMRAAAVLSAELSATPGPASEAPVSAPQAAVLAPEVALAREPEVALAREPEVALAAAPEAAAADSEAQGSESARETPAFAPQVPAPAAPRWMTPPALKEQPLLARYLNDRARDGEDKLGIRDDVRALADVIAVHDRTPPLTVGLFGPWGAGKTFFMDHLKKRLAVLEASARTAAAAGRPSAYCRHVVHVDFNAWQYADGNLWANLVHCILAQLAQAVAPRGETPDRVREALFQKLNIVQEPLAERERTAERLAKQRGELEDELRRLETERENIRREIAPPSASAVMQAVVKIPRVEKLIREATQLWDDSAAHDQLEKLGEIQRALSGVAGRLGAAWAWWGKAGRHTRTLALGMLGLSVLAPFASAYLKDLSAVWATLGVILSTGVVWANRLLPQLRRAEVVLSMARQAQSAVDAETTRQLAENESRSRQALARVVDLQSQIAQVRSEQRQTETQIATIQGEIAQLSAGSQLREFIQQHSTSEEHRQHLGIVATLRNDFSQLQQFLREVHESKVESAEYPVDRVVLYVDDLDRCPKDRVVEVLQAVHLLLDFPLFVAVVSADPRWLLCSLEERYGVELGRSVAHGRPQQAIWATSPQDFLEKIFQIPFTLRPMNPTGYRDFLRYLVPVAPEVPSPTQLAAVEEADPEPDSLHITEHELALMERLAGAKLTPRSTKRFVNLYYLVRASIPRQELEDFVGTADSPGSCLIHMFLLGALIAWPDAAEELFAELQRSPHARIGEVLQRVERNLEVERGHGAPNQASELIALARVMGAPSRASLFLEPARRIERFSFRRGSARRAPEGTSPPLPAPKNGFEVQA